MLCLQELPQWEQPQQQHKPGLFSLLQVKLMHYLQDMSKASREALQSSSLLKYRKCFENTLKLRRFTDLKTRNTMRPACLSLADGSPAAPHDTQRWSYCSLSLLSPSSSLSLTGPQATPECCWLWLCHLSRGVIEELSSARHLLPTEALTHCNQGGTSAPFD